MGESTAVSYHWKTSMNVGSLVTWGSGRRLAHPVSLHRLVDHRSFADDRVLLDPLRSAAEHQRRDVLAVVDRHRRHVGRGLLWRGQFLGSLVGLRSGHGGLVLHLVRDLRG